MGRTTHKAALTYPRELLGHGTRVNLRKYVPGCAAQPQLLVEPATT